MVSLETPVCDFDKDILGFSLPGVDGKTWTPELCRGEKGLLVMFICNHCPYVKSIRERIVRDTRELMALGVNSVAIMSNDPAEYEEDGKNWCKEHRPIHIPPELRADIDASIAESKKKPRKCLGVVQGYPCQILPGVFENHGWWCWVHARPAVPMCRR